MTQWQAIVFDLDDTLYPEQDFVQSGFQAVAQWADMYLGISSTDGFQTLMRLHKSGIRGDTFDKWLAVYDCDTSLVTQLVEIYRNAAPSIRPFSDVPSLLCSLRPYYKLGIVSDGFLDVQRRKLAALNIEHFFDSVVFSDEWGRERWKPHPHPFEVVCERLEIPCHAAVYVADNPLKDFVGAKHAGLTTIWSTHAQGDYCVLRPPSRDHEPDYTIDSLRLLSHLLVKQ